MKWKGTAKRFLKSGFERGSGYFWNASSSFPLLMWRIGLVSAQICSECLSRAFTFVATYGGQMTQRCEPHHHHLLLEVGRSVHAGLGVTPRATSEKERVESKLTFYGQDINSVSMTTYYYWFLRERKGEREKKTLIGCLLYATGPGGSTWKTKYVPWPGINPQPFGVWDDSPTNRATQPGL